MASRSTASVKIPVKYDKDVCVVRLHGGIDNQSVFALCDEVDLAIDYYHYRKIRLEIDSSGGSTQSLDYYVSKLHEWQLRGILFETKALTMASSAAAYLLVFGELGHRSCYSSARILLHFAGTKFGASESVGQREMEHRVARLADLDGRFVNLVAGTVGDALLKCESQTYPIVPDGYTIESLKPKWDEIGIQFVKLNSTKRTKAVLNRMDDIKEIIRRIHEYGEGLEPYVALSLLLIDKVDDIQNERKYLSV